MRGFVQDLRYAVRTLGRTPAFTLVALLTLALGVGANSSIFSVINAALLKPLPYPNPERLMLLYERDVTAEGSGANVVALANFLDWQKQSRTFSAMAAERQNAFNLGGNDRGILPERINGAICSWSLFASLGVQPMLGRAFTAAEDRHGAQPVAIISYGLWQRRFGGARDILGGQIRLDSKNYNIVGLMPQGFGYPERKTEVWVPVQQILGTEDIAARGAHQFYVVGRTRDGVSAQQAAVELDSIERGIYAQHPGALVGRGATIRPLAEEGTRNSRTALMVLFTAVGCLLLIACVNIANLLLARGSERRREMAIRSALGAGSARLQRQLLTESLLLSLCGAAIGLLLAYGLTSILTVRAGVLLSLGDIDTSARIELDFWVFLFTAGIALITGLAIGIFPAWQAARADVSSGLKDNSRSATASRSQRRYRNALVTVEVALSMMLLVAAGLLVRSFAELRRVQPGVRVDQMLTAGLSLPDMRYDRPSGIAAFARQLVTRLESIPGVRAAGLVSCLPVGGYCGDNSFHIDGQPLAPGQFIFSLYRAASPGYFAAAGIPILHGRALSEEDRIDLDPKHPRDGAMVISQSMARKFFPSQTAALGKRVLLRSDGPGYRVVGIVGDVLIDLDRQARPTMYVPLDEGNWTDFYAVIHTAGDPASIAAAVRREITSLDPDIPAFEIRTMAGVLDVSAARREFTVMLLGLFAGLAVVLAAVGLYGVLSYSVIQRTAEIGIRMALGAAQSQVRWLVLIEGMRPAVIGVILGIAGAAWTTRFLQSLLFGVTADDGVTFAAVPVLLLAIAVAACLIPAWRATRVDPAIALRSE